MFRLLRFLVLLLTFGVSGARAESYALIFWIGTYAEPSAKLGGIDIDARLARDMVRRMGVADRNVVELSNQQLHFQGMRQAVLKMRTVLQSDDTLILYFSGHGQRRARAATPGCQEGLVTQDGRLYLDALLKDDLAQVASIAGKVIMFNDSCHSGAMVSKGYLVPEQTSVQAKAYPLEPLPDETSKDVASDAADRICATPVNVAKSFASPMAANASFRERMFYVSASRDDEVAFASKDGSFATRAWHACLQDASTDANGDGVISGTELTDCARRWMRVNAPRIQQTITPSLNSSLALTAPVKGR